MIANLSAECARCGPPPQEWGVARSWNPSTCWCLKRRTRAEALDYMPGPTVSLLCRDDGGYLDRFGFRVERARDTHFGARKFLRHFLVAQRVSVLAVIQDVCRAMRA